MFLNGKIVKGVLLDITGVLAESSAEGDGLAVQGSVQAVQKLRDQGKYILTIFFNRNPLILSFFQVFHFDL